MFFLATALAFFFIANTMAVDYVINPDKEKDFDGIAVTTLKKPINCDRKTQKGDRLKVHFNASMPDGTLIESTWARKKAFDFVIGEGMVISGFEYGLRDMCIGERRFLMVPPKYAYGNWQLGSNVPARVTFHFTVELVDFSHDARKRKSNMFNTIDVNDDGLLSPDEVKRYLSNEQLEDNPGSMKQLLRDIFVQDDSNSDGFIDRKEFKMVKHDEL